MKDITILFIREFLKQLPSTEGGPTFEISARGYTVVNKESSIVYRGHSLDSALQALEQIQNEQ